MISVDVEPSSMSNILNVIENTVGKDDQYTDIYFESLSSFVRTGPPLEWGYSLELRANSNHGTYCTFAFTISEQTKDLLEMVLSSDSKWDRICPIDAFLEEMYDLVMMDSL